MSTARTPHPIRTLAAFVGDVSASVGWRTLLAALLIGTTGLVEGIGLLLLLPLLQAVGIDGGSAAAGLAPLPQALRFGNPPGLEPALLAFALVACLQALFLMWQSRVTYALEHEYVARARATLYAAVFRTRWVFLVQRRAADIGHALTTDLQRAGIAAYQLMTLASAVVTAAVYIAVALFLSPLTTAVAFVAALVPIAITWRGLRRSAHDGDRVASANAAVHAAAIEHLASAKTAKSYGAEERNRAIFVELAHEVAEANAVMLRDHTNQRAFVQISSAVLLALLVLVAVRGLALPGAALLVLLLVFARLMPRLSAVHSGALTLVSLLPSFTIARQLLRDCEAAAQPATATAQTLPFSTAVRLDHVSFTYPDMARPAICDVTMEIPAGATIGLAGPSGAGKTTIADILLGLLEPQAGRVAVDGVHLDESRLESWRSEIGYVAQDTFLFHDTVHANLTWAQPGATDDQLWEALRLAAADGFVRALPNGIETMLGDRGVRLSGGERQRLALARAFLRRPRLLILDEATSALDSENEQVILSALAALHGRMTVLLITHRLGVLKDADDIYVVDDGRIVESGRWHALREHQAGRLASLARAQGVD